MHRLSRSIKKGEVGNIKKTSEDSSRTDTAGKASQKGSSHLQVGRDVGYGISRQKTSQVLRDAVQYCIRLGQLQSL
jgi:hypothetical protein